MLNKKIFYSNFKNENSFHLIRISNLMEADSFGHKRPALTYTLRIEIYIDTLSISEYFDFNLLSNR
jgi:hypothetical protein